MGGGVLGQGEINVTRALSCKLQESSAVSTINGFDAYSVADAENAMGAVYQEVGFTVRGLHRGRVTMTANERGRNILHVACRVYIPAMYANERPEA